jgi:hypothetical protein
LKIHLHQHLHLKSLIYCSKIDHIYPTYNYRLMNKILYLNTCSLDISFTCIREHPLEFAKLRTPIMAPANEDFQTLALGVNMPRKAVPEPGSENHYFQFISITKGHGQANSRSGRHICSNVLRVAHNCASPFSMGQRLCTSLQSLITLRQIEHCQVTML